MTTTSTGATSTPETAPTSGLTTPGVRWPLVQIERSATEGHRANCDCRWCDPDGARDRLEELGARRPAWMVMLHVEE